MSPAQIFTITNGIAAVAWLVLAVLPGRRWVTGIVTGRAVPALFAVVYIAIVVMHLPGADGSFATLAGVARLFANPWLLLAGWANCPGSIIGPPAYGQSRGSAEVTDYAPRIAGGYLTWRQGGTNEAKAGPRGSPGARLQRAGE